ncbi:hypothetical protein HK405_013185, partial [Cladochytrium tenue]
DAQYELHIRQDPIRARMSGFTHSKDRRLLYSYHHNFVCHASLWSPERDQDLSVVVKDTSVPASELLPAPPARRRRSTAATDPAVEAGDDADDPPPPLPPLDLGTTSAAALASRGRGSPFRRTSTGPTSSSSTILSRSAPPAAAPVAAGAKQQQQQQPLPPPPVSHPDAPPVPDNPAASAAVPASGSPRQAVGVLRRRASPLPQSPVAVTSGASVVEAAATGRRSSYPVSPPAGATAAPGSAAMQPISSYSMPAGRLVSTPVTASTPSRHGSLASPPLQRVLLGTLAAPSLLLEDEDGCEVMLFVFSDLSVRLQGRYCLRFLLLDISTPDRSEALAVAWSGVFDVYSAKLFPGMTQSTPLSRHLSRQGVPIHIRVEPSAGRPGRRGSAAVPRRGGSGGPTVSESSSDD